MISRADFISAPYNPDTGLEALPSNHISEYGRTFISVAIMVSNTILGFFAGIGSANIGERCKATGEVPLGKS